MKKSLYTIIISTILLSTSFIQTKEIIYLHKQETITRSPKQTLKELKSQGNCIVIFYADWCNPCKRSIPVIEQLASLLPDFTIIKINYDSYKDLAQKYIKKYDMKGIPSFLFFKNGKLIDLYSRGSQTVDEWLVYINELYKIECDTIDSSTNN